MSNKDLHVDRIKPEFSVSESGIVSWKASLTDYDASLFHRGKTVTNDEFNTLFLNKTYQNNYLADSLTEFFKTHFPEAVYRTFKSRFNMRKNFVKVFDNTVWGSKQADGYYYITIPASEHGIVQPPDETPLAGMNVDTEMYLLDEATGTFYEVTQVETDVDNTVQLYTDDNTLSGFVIIRSNDKSFALTEGHIDVSQVDGIADVARSNDYRELNFRPDDDIEANRDDIDAMLSRTEPLNGHPFVHNADYATNAENAEYATNLLGSGTIQNQPVSAIFEEGSSFVKNATTAVNYSATGEIANKFSALEQNITQGILQTNQRIDALTVDNTTVVNAAAVQMYTVSDNAADIEQETALKLVSAKAIKKFMEEYYMKSYTGTVTLLSHAMSNATINKAYIVKQGNNVEMTLSFNYPSTGISYAKGGSTIFTLQLSEGFYNTQHEIVTVLDPNQATRSLVLYISPTGLATCIYKTPESYSSGELAAIAYQNLSFKYTI